MAAVFIFGARSDRGDPADGLVEKQGASGNMVMY
jgi:hypothetical protein